MPSVRVWDADEPSHPQITELEKGHKYGVSCVVSRDCSMVKGGWVEMG